VNPVTPVACYRIPRRFAKRVSGSKSRILRAVVALVRAANISRSASILTREKRIFLRPPFFVAHNG